MSRVNNFILHIIEGVIQKIEFHYIVSRLLGLLYNCVDDEMYKYRLHLKLAIH